MQFVNFINLCSRFRRAPCKVVAVCAAAALVVLVGSATVASDAAAADVDAKLLAILSSCCCCCCCCLRIRSLASVVAVVAALGAVFILAADIVFAFVGLILNRFT